MSKILDKVFQGIRTLESPTGASLASIKKYLKAEHQFEQNARLLTVLKKAVADGTLVQNKSSYMIPGEVYAPPPDMTVEVKEEREGEGKAAGSGDTVTMKYEGRLENGTVFDSADKFRFTIDAGEVIKGWDKGIAGMKKGGRRVLVIPPKLGYGKKGSPPEIPPDATLIFDVTLTSISK
mmetsp:Transcript_20930/g.48366  ORF Transcript_20930/g.48366 Transcript_20930/m.48366 type:complete len:179 (+) Transcript_20930:214-750(+)